MPFQIVRNDITAMKADAIVNTANPEAAYARGTDGAIYRAAGAEKLLAARRRVGSIATGEAAITPAFALDARYIIHTAGPRWQGGTHDEAAHLKRCYENSLRLARKHGCKSIAFPLISTGSYGFPKGEALQIALSAIREFLSKEEMTIYLTVFDRESFELSGKLFADIDSYIDENYVAGIDSYVDENYVADKLAEEYDAALESSLPLPPSGNMYTPMTEMPPAPASYTMSSPQTKTPRTARPPKAAQAAAPIPPAAVPKNRPQLSKLSETAPAAVPQAAKSKEKGHTRGFTDFLRPKTKSPVPERSIDDVIAELGETFQQRLLRLIDERDLTDVEVYKRANLDRKLFSKIRCNVSYRPKKATAIALALALELNLDETKDLLSRAELALSPSSKFDLIIQYFIDREVYDIYAINLALFQHGQPLLGG